jgi:SPP1 gp7 family putative phage head morphogenesis protein
MMPELDEQFWSEDSEELIKVMLPLITNAALKGAETALTGLQDEFGLGVDWALVNEQVRKWAQGYTYSLVHGITGTSRDLLQSAVSEWISTGQPLEELVATLEPMFGTVRAEMIAVTEVTRCFAEGNMETWRSSGVVGKMRWQTAQDELVCPICEPLAGEEADLGQGFAEFGNPPAHVNCRCWIQPVVEA